MPAIFKLRHYPFKVSGLCGRGFSIAPGGDRVAAFI